MLINRLSNLLGVCAIAYSITACHPFIIDTEKAAVVIYNKTAIDIGYQVLLSNEWTPVISIAPGGAEFSYYYEKKPADDSLPDEYGRVKLNTVACEIVIERNDLPTYLSKDPNGRLGWNLNVDIKLLQKLGCP